MRAAATAAAVAAALALATPALAAGPTAIATDGSVVYAGYESGGVARFAAADGSHLGNWGTTVADANGALGAIVAMDVAPGGSTVWVLDSNRRVQELGADGGYVRGFRLGPCEGANDPDPGAEGGIDVSDAAVYVAHPCANAVERFPLASLPPAGPGSPPSIGAEVYSPHGIAAPASEPATGARALHVTQPRSAAVRRYDLSSLAQIGDAIPVTHTGTPDDVHVGTAGGEARVIVSETQNPAPGYAHRLYAFAPTSDPATFIELFNLGGLGGAPGRLDGAVAFDAVEADSMRTVVVADRGNERVQRLTAASPEDAGNVVWATSAPDPGPPPLASQPNVGGGGGAAGGGAAAGGAARPGVSINDGARYTASVDVLLRIDEPAGASAIEISHRAGFASPERVPPGTRTLDWELVADEPDKRRRRVFVRFPGSGRGAVSDEIRLDRRRPKVASARVLRRSGRWVLRVRASDASSGLAELQLASDRRGPYEPREFEPDVRLDRSRDARWVRVADGVGNISDAKRVRPGSRR